MLIKQVAMHILKKTFNLFKIIFDAILPNRCASCGKIVEDSGVCGECYGELNFISSPYCKICGTPIETAVTSSDFICGECAKTKKTYIDLTRSALVYNDAAKKIVLPFKFKDRTDLAPLLAKMALRAGGDFWNEADLLVPVPLHRKRIFFRKYNQSALITGELSKISSVKCDNSLLLRSINTKPQVKCTAKQRLKNVKNAFEINSLKNVNGKNIILVDDVLTTGATVNECAKVLKQNGANKVYVLTIARVIK